MGFLLLLFSVPLQGQEFFELDANAGANLFALPREFYGRTVLVSNRAPNIDKALKKREQALKMYNNAPNIKGAKKIYRYNTSLIRLKVWKKKQRWADILPVHKECLLQPKGCTSK